MKHPKVQINPSNVVVRKINQLKSCNRVKTFIKRGYLIMKKEDNVIGKLEKRNRNLLASPKIPT